MPTLFLQPFTNIFLSEFLICVLVHAKFLLCRSLVKFPIYQVLLPVLYYKSRLVDECVFSQQAGFPYDLGGTVGAGAAPVARRCHYSYAVVVCGGVLCALAKELLDKILARKRFIYNILLDEASACCLLCEYSATYGVHPLHDLFVIVAENLPAFYNNSTSHSKSIIICFVVNLICIMFVRVLDFLLYLSLYRYEIIQIAVCGYKYKR